MTEASAQRPAPPPPTPITAQAASPAPTPTRAETEPTPRPEPKPAPAPKPTSAPKPAPSSAGELLQAAIDASPTMRVRMILEKLRPITLEGGVFRAEVAPDVRNLAEMSRGTIEALLGQAAGSTVRIELEASEGGGQDTGQASENAPASGAGAGETGSAAADHPLVKRARELFDAGIVNVRPKQSGRNADR